MKRPVKLALVALGLLVSGVVRAPWESAFTGELRASGLLEKPIADNVRNRIGQTSAVVALGGLRTFVATFLNFRSMTFFSEQRWSELAETFDTMVALAPHTTYYWEIGAYHQTNNAASYYVNDSELPALRRKERWRQAIRRGRDFLERGIRVNPEEPKIKIALGRLLDDPTKGNTDFSKAADCFKAAADTGKVLPFVRTQQFFSLARAPGREAEALALGRQLYADPGRRSPTVLCLLYVLEYRAAPSMPALERALSIFRNDKQAYEELSLFWIRVRERFPLDGVATALQQLETRLNIPENDSVFRKPLQPLNDPDELFGASSRPPAPGPLIPGGK